jgi:hypothetical protein
MEPTVVLQQDVTRSERNPATELFTALVMPALNAVANSVVGSQVIAGLGFDSLVVGSEAKEAAANFMHVQQQNEAFSTLSFNYIKAAATTDSLQLAA